MPNRALWWVVGGAIGGLALALYLPPMQRIFKFEALAWHDLLFCAVAAAAECFGRRPSKFFRVCGRTWRRDYRNSSNPLKSA
jgi:hypothetical protein